MAHYERPTCLSLEVMLLRQTAILQVQISRMVFATREPPINGFQRLHDGTYILTLNDRENKVTPQNWLMKHPQTTEYIYTVDGADLQSYRVSKPPTESDNRETCRYLKGQKWILQEQPQNQKWCKAHNL